MSSPLNGLLGAEGKFLVIPGEEVSQMLADPLHSAAHINAINSHRFVEPIGVPRLPLGRTAPFGVTPAQTFARNIAAIRAAGGLPQINHPNLQVVAAAGGSLRPARSDPVGNLERNSGHQQSGGHR